MTRSQRPVLCCTSSSCPRLQRGRQRRGHLRGSNTGAGSGYTTEAVPAGWACPPVAPVAPPRHRHYAARCNNNGTCAAASPPARPLPPRRGAPRQRRAFLERARPAERRAGWSFMVTLPVASGVSISRDHARRHAAAPPPRSPRAALSSAAAGLQRAGGTSVFYRRVRRGRARRGPGGGTAGIASLPCLHCLHGPGPHTRPFFPPLCVSFRATSMQPAQRSNTL